MQKNGFTNAGKVLFRSRQGNCSRQREHQCHFISAMELNAQSPVEFDSPDDASQQPFEYTRQRLPIAAYRSLLQVDAFFDSHCSCNQLRSVGFQYCLPQIPNIEYFGRYFCDETGSATDGRRKADQLVDTVQGHSQTFALRIGYRAGSSVEHHFCASSHCRNRGSNVV